MSRYPKVPIFWQGEILETAIAVLRDYLGKDKIWSTIDIVIPSFRCDPDILLKFSALRSRRINVSILVSIIVDNPSSPLLPQVIKLTDLSSNHLVRIIINETNIGASGSRNVGIASSFGDLIVLLDDDIIPDAELVDCYLGASMRNPDAQIFVGLTELPKPRGLLQHAISASMMTFFYSIAKRMKNPPWGVTGNMCIRGRTNNVVFSGDYPKSGGGEDVDYCFRTKELYPFQRRNSVIVAVPEAKVQHPFWVNIPKQVLGWAWGDVRCISNFPHKTFYVPPNWIEIVLLLSVYSIFSHSFECIRRVIFSIIATEFIISSFSSSAHIPHGMPMRKMFIISAIASVLLMLQDVVRLVYKVVNFKFAQICLQFDWFDGQESFVVASKITIFLRYVSYSVVIALEIYYWNRKSLDLNGILLVVIVTSICGGILQYLFDFSRDAEALVYLARLKKLPISFDTFAAQPFVILAFIRTGSNLLCGLLHNHSEVVMHNEVFNLAKIWTYQTEDIRSDPLWKPWDIFSRDKDPVSFLKMLYSNEPITKRKTFKAIGFKLFPDHWNNANSKALHMLLGDQRVKKIVLRRENYLEVYASLLKADKTGNYLLKSLDGVKITVNLKSFQDFIEYYDKCYEHIGKLLLNQNTHQISYEALSASNDGSIIRGVQNFLGVDYSYTPKQLALTKKQSTNPINEDILNFAEVNEAFRLHPKAPYIFSKDDN